MDLKAFGGLMKMKLHSLDMILGEKRQITLELIPNSFDGEIIISTANYLLIHDDKIESSGIPEIDGLNLTVTISPEKVGTYTLEFHINIYGEIIIRRFYLYVKG